MAGKRSRKARQTPQPGDTGVLNSGQGEWEDTNGQTGEGSPADDQPEYEARVRFAIEMAEQFVDSTIAQQRMDAASYYKGQPFGDEEEGRSQVVLTEVRDTILSILPSLLRIFTSSDKVVQIEGRRPEAQEGADQATDAINYIFLDQNNGFLQLHHAFKDGLAKKLGILTWWAEEHTRVKAQSYSGMSEEEVLYWLEANPDSKVVSVEPGEPLPDLTPTYAFTAQTVEKGKRYIVRPVPPEEFLIDARATCPEDADIVGTRQMLTVSELVQMGFKLEDIEEHGAPGADESAATWSAEKAQRTSNYEWPDQTIDRSMRRVRYTKVYVRIDQDGDGIAELRKIECIGPANHIMRDTIAEEAPFALFCPDPEPHTVYGNSVADATMDIQRIKSHVMRDVLDSLKQSIFPRTAIVEGQVNVDDALNKEVGAVIRMKQIGAIQDLATPFVGQQALPVLDLIDQIKAQRTGVTPASQGLDADLLQSTTRAAVTAQISAAQERIELIARIFAETGMMQLFKGLLRLIVRHQDKPFFIRLRGKFTQVDPTGWDPDMDVTVNVGLGRGDDQQQLQMLGMIAQKQEQIMLQMGIANPFVGPGEYANTLAAIVQKGGFKNPTLFFKQVTPEIAQQIEQAAQSAPPKPSPEEMLAKVEMAKVLAEGYSRVEKTAQERVQIQLQADLDRDTLETNVYLKALDLSGKYGFPPPINELVQVLNKPRPDINALTQVLIDQEKGTGTAVLGQIAQVLGPSPDTAPPGLDTQNGPGQGGADPSGSAPVPGSQHMDAGEKALAQSN